MVCIRCPYCGRTHEHGIGIRNASSQLTGQTRQSHCHVSGYLGSTQYRLHYPFEDDEEPTSWEIDKEQRTFLTVGLDSGNDHDENERANISEDERPVSCVNDEQGSESETLCKDSELNASLDAMRLGQEPQDPRLEPPRPTADEIFQELMQDQDYRFKCYVSHCILNELHDVSILMKRYNDDFLGASDVNGNNGVALAAVEGHLKLVQWLHRKGCNIDSENCRKRTPLMAAALWGRLHIVDYLLKHGANANLKDHKGRSALDLALPSRRNSSERHRRLVDYHEPPEADLHRRHIAIRLEAVTGTSPCSITQALSAQKSSPGFLRNSINSSGQSVVHYYQLNKLYLIPDERKAIGRLDRGPLFPVISAMSGYSHSEWDTDILDNKKWTCEVQRLAMELGIHVNRGFASHVEKQLVAFYVAKHVLLDSDNQDCFSLGGEVGDLCDVQPPKPPIAGTILVSKDVVCRDCEDFIRQVKCHIQINLTVKCGDVV